MTNPEEVTRTYQENARLYKKAAKHLQKINAFLLDNDPTATNELPEVVTWVNKTSNTELIDLQEFQSKLNSDAKDISFETSKN